MIKLPETQNENPVFEILIIGVVLLGILSYLILAAVQMGLAALGISSKTEGDGEEL